MALKLQWYFYLLNGKPLGHYFQVPSPYYEAAQCKQKTPIPVSRRQVRSEKGNPIGNSGVLSIHLPKPVSIDLIIKPDSVLTNPIGNSGV